VANGNAWRRGGGAKPGGNGGDDDVYLDLVWEGYANEKRNAYHQRRGGLGVNIMALWIMPASQHIGM